MEVHNFDTLCTWLYDNKNFIDYVKVTNINPIGFNTLEGNRYIINIKIIIPTFTNIVLALLLLLLFDNKPPFIFILL